MIKSVQVEERRCLCDICLTRYFVMHSPTDTKRDGWVHADNFATSGKNLDICPTCVNFLKSHFYNFYTKSVSDEPEIDPVCSLHG